MIRKTAAKPRPAGPPPMMKLRAPPTTTTPSPTRAGFDMRYGRDDRVISRLKRGRAPRRPTGRAFAPAGAKFCAEHDNTAVCVFPWGVSCIRQWQQRECEERRRKRIGKLLKESGLPLEKSLANFDGKRLPVKVSRQMKVLLDGGFLDRQENLLIFGNPGAGKSHLLCAIAQELIAARGRKIKYTSCPLLVQDLLAAKRDLRLGKEIKKLAKYVLLR